MATSDIDDSRDTRGAAIFLGLDPDRGQRMLEQMRVKHRGPAFYKIGKLVRYHRSDLIAYRDSRRVETQDTEAK